jgi:hypothetical protein
MHCNIKFYNLKNFANIWSLDSTESLVTKLQFRHPMNLSFPSVPRILFNRYWGALFSGLKQSELDPDHSPASITKVKNKRGHVHMMLTM